MFKVELDDVAVSDLWMYWCWARYSIPLEIWMAMYDMSPWSRILSVSPSQLPVRLKARSDLGL